MKFKLKDNKNIHNYENVLKKAVEDGNISKVHFHKKDSMCNYFKKSTDFLKHIYPSSKIVSSTVVMLLMSVLVLYICGTVSTVNKLEKEKKVRESEIFELNQNLSATNSKIAQINDKDRIQQETINSQQEDLTQKENEISNADEKRQEDVDKVLQTLDEIVESMSPGTDNFNSVISRGASSVEDLSANFVNTKATLLSVVGNTPKVQEIINDLDQTEFNLTDYLRRYPDRMPADGPFTSPFGYRRDPLDGTTRFHSGLDIGASYGSTVVAAAYGTVEVVGNDSSYGNYVKINHGNGYQTVYAHNSQILVTVGQVVDKGQPIALVGATGRVTGPHCHFEIIENGVFVDPKPFIT